MQYIRRCRLRVLCEDFDAASICGIEFVSVALLACG
jgi:hypothetical protein